MYLTTTPKITFTFLKSNFLLFHIKFFEKLVPLINKLQPLSYQSTSNITPRLPLLPSRPTPKIYNATTLLTHPLIHIKKLHTQYIEAQIYVPTASCCEVKLYRKKVTGEWLMDWCCINEVVKIRKGLTFCLSLRVCGRINEVVAYYRVSKEKIFHGEQVKLAEHSFVDSQWQLAWRRVFWIRQTNLAAKIFFASFRLFKRLPRTTKWMSESNTKELIVFGRNRLKSAYPSVYHINSLSRAATIAWSVRAIVIKRTVIIIILSCRLLSVSYQPLTGAKLRKRVSKLLHPRRENFLFFFRVRRKLPSVKHRPK